jgi:hypothetical protein
VSLHVACDEVRARDDVQRTGWRDFQVSNPNRSCTDSLNFSPLRVREAEFLMPV